MTTYTAHFHFAVPDFNVKPWQATIKDTFNLVDTVIYNALVALNIAAWDNDTNFTVGNVAIDTDGKFYTCLVTHTSAASPTSFLQDRTDNPTYWQAVASLLNPRQAWANSTVYAVSDVTYDTAAGIVAVCNLGHTSSPSPATLSDDLDAYWDILIQFDPPAAANVVTYDGATSGLAATDVQAAIDEVVALIETDFDTLAANDFLVKTSSGNLTAERVVTDTGTIEWDWGTAGQAKAKVVDAGIGTTQLAANAVTNVKMADDSVDTAEIVARAVTFAKIAAMNTSKLLGRTTASTGDIEEISVGSSLSLSAGTLNASKASTGDAQTGTEANKLMTPATTLDAINYRRTEVVLDDQDSISAATTATFALTAGYDVYDFWFLGIAPDSFNSYFAGRFSSDGGSTYDSTANHYNVGGVSGYDAGANGTGSQSNDEMSISKSDASSHYVIAGDAKEELTGRGTLILAKSTTQYKSWQSDVVKSRAGGDSIGDFQRDMHSYQWLSTAAATHIQFYFTTGSTKRAFSGRIVMLGRVW